MENARNNIKQTIGRKIKAGTENNLGLTDTGLATTQSDITKEVNDECFRHPRQQATEYYPK